MNKIIIASGPVIVENGRVMLNKHGEDEFWKFCGGRVENFDADLEENAKREVKEEMGIDIEILDHKPFIMHVKKEDKDVILVHFLAKRVGEVKKGEDIRETGWFETDNLPEDIGPNIKPTLKHFGLIN